MYKIIGFIVKPLGMLLSLIYDLVGNYGISIIIFTIIVKFALYPLYSKQIKSTVRMAEVQPKMQEIQQRYANDRQMMNIKMSELYKEEKFNPMGGCLPMIIQMPIIFGLFALLRRPLDYIASDSMIFAAHESFLWIMDLSQPDKWILPIAAGVATFISFTMTQQQQQVSGAANQMNGMMKGMRIIFPIMIVWMGRTFPAGLALYWFIGQVVQIFFNLHLNRVRERLRFEAEARKKNRKKIS